MTLGYTDPHLISFLCLWLIRYVRLIVSLVAYYRLKPIPLPTRPTLCSSDVTVIIPTTASNSGCLMDCLLSIAKNDPRAITIVTARTRMALVKDWCKTYQLHHVQVLGVEKLNKRHQMIAGLRIVKTTITVFADDDVIWLPEYLRCLLAAFERPIVGAAGTNQRVRRSQCPNVWHFLGTAYLERRNFNLGATNNIDGAVSTLSGRTSAYRTSILQDDAFYTAFSNDTWLGRPLNSDDDKFLTRWVFSHDWEIRLQFMERAVLYTTLEEGWNFYYQGLRWARAHWRGNFIVMMRHDYWYRKHPWSCYAVYLASLQTPSIAVDASLAYLLFQGLSAFPKLRAHAMAIFGLWLMFTKTVKLVPHLMRYPWDIIYLPASIAFSYAHGIINLIALASLHKTGWGSRILVDTPDQEKSSAPH